jgi:hypothetical protein
VPPGEYVLQVSAQNPRDETEADRATQFLTVNGRDIPDLYVQVRPGSRLAGRVVYEGVPDVFNPTELVRSGLAQGASVEITTVAVDQDLAPLNGRSARDSVNPLDPLFDLRGLHGPRLVRLGRSAGGWFLKSVSINGIDVTDTPLEFGTQAESLEAVEIVVTRRLSEVSGGLVDGRGQSVAGYVVVFPIDRDRWVLGSRFVRFTRSLPGGSFSVRGLPPGGYHVAAVERLLEGIGEWQDPAFLEDLAPGAVKITVSDNQQLTVSPRLVTR